MRNSRNGIFSMFWGGRNEVSDELLASMGPLKRKWENARISLPLHCFLSKVDFEFAFTEVFLCKEIRLTSEARFDPQPLMRLHALLQCSKLNIRKLEHSVTVNDIVEWVEREKPKQWDDPLYLEVHSDRVIGGFVGLVDALRKVSAT